MILDNELAIVSATALDLESVRPGPGNPIKCFASGVTLDITITTGATAAAAGDLQVVTGNPDGIVEFELPSSTLKFVMFTFADGEVYIVLPGVQTNT